MLQITRDIVVFAFIQAAEQLRYQIIYFFLTIQGLELFSLLACTAVQLAY